MRICAWALSAGSSASMSPHRSRSFQASRTTAKARAMAAAGAPVRRPILRTKVGPQRLISEFTTCSAAISRRSRWARIAGSYFSCSAVGK